MQPTSSQRLPAAKSIMPNCSHKGNSTQRLSLGLKSLMHWAIHYVNYSNAVILLKVPNRNVLNTQKESVLISATYWKREIKPLCPAQAHRHALFCSPGIKVKKNLQNVELSSCFVKPGLILLMPLSHTFLFTFSNHNILLVLRIATYNGYRSRFCKCLKDPPWFLPSLENKRVQGLLFAWQSAPNSC